MKLFSILIIIIIIVAVMFFGGYNMFSSEKSEKWVNVMGGGKHNETIKYWGGNAILLVGLVGIFIILGMFVKR